MLPKSITTDNLEVLISNKASAGDRNKSVNKTVESKNKRSSYRSRDPVQHLPVLVVKEQQSSSAVLPVNGLPIVHKQIVN